jgi:peroxiredoxin Q/BCP
MTSHEKFKSKECFTVDLLSDSEELLCNLFSVIKEKNMYGKIVLGIERSTFLIDEAGKLAAEWRGIKAPGHATQVLEKVKTL